MTITEIGGVRKYAVATHLCSFILGGSSFGKPSPSTLVIGREEWKPIRSSSWWLSLFVLTPCLCSKVFRIRRDVGGETWLRRPSSICCNNRLGNPLWLMAKWMNPLSECTDSTICIEWANVKGREKKRKTSYRLHKDFPVAVALQQNCLGEDAFHWEVGKHFLRG